MSNRVALVGLDNDLAFSLREHGYTIFGYIANRSDPTDLDYLGDDEAAVGKIPDDVGFLMAIDQCSIKQKLIGMYAPRLVTFVSNRATVSDKAVVGEGAIIQRGAFVSDGAKIGRAVKINCNSTIHHDSQIGDLSSISPNCTVLGNVRIGQGTLIGASSTIRNHATIGANCVIGMGSNVVSDIADNEMVFGNPAKPQGASRQTG